MGERPNLLLFDDDPETVDFVKDRLTDSFDVKFCTSEAELAELIEPARFAVIACDVQINTSDKTGYEIIDSIREEYHIRHIPVVVYSAVRNMGEIAKTEKTYYVAYVVKGESHWDKTLLNECEKALNKNPRLIKADNYEVRLKDHIDDKLDIARWSPSAEIWGVHGDENLTVKTAIEWLRNMELDDESAACYGEALDAYADYLKDQ